jgi:hypothetical protein
MTQVEVSRQSPRLSFLSLGIVGLAVLTALLHLVLAIGLFMTIAGGTNPGGFPVEGLMMFGGLFILNCLGYLALVFALYRRSFQRFRRITRWLLIGYTALTLLLWAVIASSGADLMAYIDKAAEVVLIILLLIEGWQIRQQSA